MNDFIQLQKALRTGFQENRVDSQIGIFSRSLEKYASTIVERKFAPSDIDTFVYTSMDLAFGEESIIYTLEDVFGDVPEGGVISTDVPYAWVSESEEGSKIVSIPFGYRYTLEELEAAALSATNRGNPASGNVIARRMEAALKGLRQRNHLIGMYGAKIKGSNSTAGDVYGLLNNPFVTTYDETSLDVLGTATAEDLHLWFVDQVVKIKKATELTGEVDTVLMSIDLMQKLSTIRSASASDATAMDLITKALEKLGIRRFFVRNEVGKYWLESKGHFASGTNKDMLVFYNSDIQCVQRHVTSVATSPLEYTNNVYSQVYRQRVSSVQINYPSEFLYVTYPNTL